MSIVHTHLTHKHTEPIPEPPPAEPALIFQKKKNPPKKHPRESLREIIFTVISLFATPFLDEENEIGRFQPTSQQRNPASKPSLDNHPTDTINTTNRPITGDALEGKCADRSGCILSRAGILSRSRLLDVSSPQPNLPPPGKVGR